jgi:hypothetical protein
MFVLVAFQATADAQTNPIVPDRPGFSTGAYTVKPGRFNIEFGYQYSFNNHNTDTSTHTTPLSNLRIGITSKIEFDLLWDGWNIDDQAESSPETSVTDASVGGKYRIVEIDKFNLTALGLLSFPVGSSPSTSGHIDPRLGLLWDYSLSNNVSIFGNILANSDVTKGDRNYSIQPIVGVSFCHTSRLGTYLEYNSDIPLHTGGSSEPGSSSVQNTIDGGVTYLLTDDIQLDINAGVGLDSETDNFIGTGISIRF